MSDKKKSNVSGVSWNAKNSLWIANLTHQGKLLLNKRFDNYEDAVQARKNAEKEFDIQPRRKKNRLSNEDLTRELHEFVKENGYVPSFLQFKYSQTAQKRYGSWNKFLIENGYETTISKKYSEIELFKMYQDLKKQLGRPPKSTEMKPRQTIYKRFDSWQAFKDKAEKYGQRKISDEELIKLVLQQATELGHTPFAKDFKYKSLAEFRFGNWGNFVRAAGLELYSKRPGNYELNKKNRRNLLGMRFGRLTVVAETEKSKDGKIQWLCHCDCGNDSIVKTEKLIGGFTKSCGCLSKEVPHLLKHRNEVYVEGTNLDMLHDRLPKNNNSGVRGVCFVNATQKWKAQLSVQGKKVLNKSYVNKQDAIDARKEAEAKYFRPILEKYKDK